jgi:hypothetical protein
MDCVGGEVDVKYGWILSAQPLNKGWGKGKLAINPGGDLIPCSRTFSEKYLREIVTESRLYSTQAGKHRFVAPQHLSLFNNERLARRQEPLAKDYGCAHNDCHP